MYGTFRLDEFLNWNPAVRSGCTRLLAGFSYCVSISEAQPTRRIATGPSPQQPRITKNCKSYYKVQRGDTCQSIIDKYGTFSQTEFQDWNPSVGSSCQSLWAEYNVCVGLSENISASKSKSKLKLMAPSPAQQGISSCRNYYKAISGDTCQSIADKSGISLSDL
jgi:LysM repeat protein